MVFHILWKEKMVHLRIILKMFDKYKRFYLKVVENPVDNVEKNFFSFPQIHVENLKNYKISSFGNEWKKKHINLHKIKAECT